MDQQTIIPPSGNEIPLVPHVYGGVSARFMAVMMDGLFVLVLSFLLFIPLFLLSLVANVLIAPLLIWMGAMMIPSFGFLYIVLSWLYFASMESSMRGGTYGKRFFHLRVVDEKGGRISFAHATLRFVAKFLSAIPFMLGFMMAFVTLRKQALHDLIAETLVIKV